MPIVHSRTLFDASPATNRKIATEMLARVRMASRDHPLLLAGALLGSVDTGRPLAQVTNERANSHDARTKSGMIAL